MNRQYALAALAALPFLAPSVAAQSARHQLDCGFLSTEEWRAELSAAVARGEIESPAQRPLPEIPNIVRRGRAAGYLGAIPCMTREQIFQYEDTNEILVGSFSTGELLDLMTEAANALMATHGDNYDFVGFWVNFVPDHKIGAAFYAGIENDVGGIGLDIENNRPDIGLAGDNVEGYIQMWNVNNSYWQPGTDATANFTRLALAQEFEHRFALFLPDLLDGRVMQGDNSGCGRGAHWNWQIDGQGSGMEISEWVGSSPAVPQGTFVTFNTDIPGGVFSYPDLYLMGYVTPAEMDAGVSELRFMEEIGRASCRERV
jgi:hypothetical protein